MDKDNAQLSLDLFPEAPNQELSPGDAALLDLEMIWVNLPTYQPGILISMWNQKGHDTDMREEAFVIAAVDSEQNLWQYRVEPEKTFEKARLH